MRWPWQRGIESFESRFLRYAQAHPDTCRWCLARHVALNMAYDMGAKNPNALMDDADLILLANGMPPGCEGIAWNTDDLCTACKLRAVKT
jgi:hypothetical protein